MRSPRKVRASPIKAEVANIKRQRILEQATHLFFEQGYAATTLDAVAEAMHVTKPFIYSYFANKTEILTAICETGIDESLAALDKGEHEAVKAINQLRIAMGAAGRAVIRVQKYVVVYQRELKSLDPVDARRILEKRQQFDVEVAAILARGVAEGDMRVANPSMTAVWIGGLLSWIPVWYSPAGRRKPDEVVSEFVAAVERLVQ
jgi:AcrR family transcriptional regulator